MPAGATAERRADCRAAKRADRDFAVAWAKMYGNGRVFYSTLGHVEANWDKPEFQTMMVEAIKWALKLVDADITPRPAPVPQD